MEIIEKVQILILVICIFGIFYQIGRISSLKKKRGKKNKQAINHSKMKITILFFSGLIIYLIVQLIGVCM